MREPVLGRPPFRELNSRRQKKRTLIIGRDLRRDNLKGLTQVIPTLVPLALLWLAVAPSAAVSYGLTAAITLLMSLFLLRVFVLMHECGHESLFRGNGLNKVFGFAFGVVSGMPQYVWSKHHAYHHATNGNWDKYRGPLEIKSVAEYQVLNARQQRAYQRARNIWLAPIAGFSYVVFNPRVTWMKGSVALVAHILKGKLARPGISFRAHAATFKTRYWADAEEYWHMAWNNVALLGLWVFGCWALGPLLFFVVYLASTSLAGGAGIVLFTVQHNFEHSYASGDEGWDRDTAAIRGTSFLVLPRWLHWFTANIAYHHIHHLSARIPNYCLAKCHAENEQLFSDVTRIGLSQIPAALKCILWDTRARRIISVAEHQRQRPQSGFA